MSGIWGWFGGQSAQQRKDAPKKAILDLRSQLEMLQKRQKHIENQIDEYKAKVLSHLNAGDKIAARKALKSQKRLEENLDKTADQIETLETQVYAIESTNINQETLNVLKSAGRAMKQLHGKVTIDNVDKTMDELREQHALGEEIANAITSTSIGEAIDETELDAELADLEQERLDNQMLKTGTVPVSDELHRLPRAAQGEIVKGKTPARMEEDEEEEELRKLQAEMAM